MQAVLKAHMVVKLSDPDVIDGVKQEAPIADRSMAGQVEHWVKLGQAVEALLGISEVRALKESLRAGEPAPSVEGVKERILSTLQRLAASPDRASVRARILSPGVPLFQSD